MNKVNVKNKLYAVVFLWVVLCLVMFFYAFGILDSSNSLLAANIQKQNTELVQLQAQQNSFLKAKQDLQDLSNKSLQPENFFTQDITLVNEIKTLEDVTAQNNVQFNLSGLSGTLSTYTKAAGTLSNIYAVPYNISLIGPLSNVIATLETIEHLPFITKMTTLNVSSGVNGNVNVILTAYFYLRGQ